MGQIGQISHHKKTLADPVKKGVKRQQTLDMVQGKGDKDEIYAQYAT